MKWTAAMCALGLLALVACDGGNPFEDDGDEAGNLPEIPDDSVTAEILGDLTSLDFDADSNTLTVTGLTQDGTPLVNEYTAVAGSFVPGYTTFTGQNDPLGRHATAFVASRDGVQAGVVMTGGQFNTFFGGSYFERNGSYEAPTTSEAAFDVTYYGDYAGAMNGVGPVTDLLPTVGLDPDIDTPNQTAYVRGLMFVNVDFNDMSVEGEIYDRTAILGSGSQELPDLVLVAGDLTGEGTFEGSIEQDASDPLSAADPVGKSIGSFAGAIGGDDGNAMAGGTHIQDFSEDLEDEIEYGVFVLDLCTAGDPDPVCVNALEP